MNQPAVNVSPNVSPEVIEQLARKLLASGYAPDERGANVLATYLAPNSFHVMQAIDAAPSHPLAETWLKEQIEAAREWHRQLTSARRGNQNSPPRDRSHLSPVPASNQASQAPAQQLPQQGTRQAQPGPNREPARAQHQGRPQQGAPAARPTSGGGGERVIRKEGFDQIHVYAKKAALTFEVSETRLKDNGQGDLPTVTIDAAPAGDQPRSYRWAEKVRFQITPSELHYVACVFMGAVEAVEFANHGQNNDKGLSIQSQENGLYMRVWAKGSNNPVPVSWQDFGALNALVLRQLEALTGLHGASLTAHIRACARFCPKPKPRPNNRPQQGAPGGRQ